MYVTVAYALPDATFVRIVELATGDTVAQAIAASGVLTAYPRLNQSPLKVGIFARRVTLDTVLGDGDRVELYRPLVIDPMQARRSRAVKAKPLR